MIKIKGYVFRLLLYIMLSLFLPVQAVAEEHSQALESDPKQVKEGKVVIFLSDRLTLRDWTQQDLPNLQVIIRNGAVALMNTTTPGAKNPENAYTTIGAGVRIMGGSDAGGAYNAEDVLEGTSVAKVYERRMGVESKDSQVLHLFVPGILQVNENLRYNFVPGALGGKLKESGLRTAIIGNSDVDQKEQRMAATILMDNYGKIDYGVVNSSILVKDENFLAGKRTDYQRVFDLYKNYLSKSDVVLLELGDISRLEDLGSLALPEVLSKHKQTVLKNYDQLLGSVVETLDFNKDLLIILTPCPPNEAISDRYWFAPVIMAGSGIEPGVLTSPTTKRDGIITNLDIAPTILSHFGLDKAQEMVGFPVKTIPSLDPVSFLVDLEEKSRAIYLQRPVLAHIYVTIQIIGVVLALIAILYKWKQAPYFKYFLLAMLAVPLSLVLLPLFEVRNVYLAIAITTLITSSLVYISLKTGRRQDLDPFVMIALSTSLVIIVDILLGSPLMKESPLSYDPMVGARFYGIGNEFMGVLIGSSIIGTVGLLERQKVSPKSPMLYLVPVFWFFIAVVMALPNLGTNVGGTIAAVAGFSYTFLLLMDVRLSWQRIALLGLSIIGVLFVMMFIDSMRSPENQSHIGRTASLIRTGGLEEIFNIIFRKAAVNLKLILNVTMWARVFLVSILVLSVLFFKPVGVMSVIRHKYLTIYKGLMGIVVAAVIALIFNDSGIVAAATMMIFASAPLTYLVLRQGWETQS